MVHFRSLIGAGLMLFAGAAPASDKIDKAVERGVAILRQAQDPGGLIGSYSAGSTSLAGLALLECGVKPDDPVIVKAAAAVRNDIITNNDVYYISLAIMFLDRLGDAGDVPLIQALAVRLMEGQLPAPQLGWNYKTPRPPAEEIERLRGNLKNPELKTESKKEKAPPLPANKLDPDLQRRIEALERNQPIDGSRRSEAGFTTGIWPDNSNSQFAVIALWIARRNQVPTDLTLRKAEAWYRATYESGTWPYSGSGVSPEGRCATTCAGLLGLAVGAGVARTPAMKPDDGRPRPPPKRDVLADGQVQTALNYIGVELAAMANSGVPPGPIAQRDFYFLWSLERVAMVYNLTKIGTVDWYTVGSAIILLTQQPTGGWKGRYQIEVDTSFALLFLRRSNLAGDLSAALKISQQPALTAKEPLRSDKTTKPSPAATAAAEADQLARELLTAPAARQDQILERLRDEKGGEFSDALVKVIPQLTGDAQRKARDCLAERLARMKDVTLRAKLRDPHVEYRRAAALACAVKEDRTLVGDLIAALDDKEFLVVRAVAAALRSLTGEDFGPSASASPEERTKAISAWKAWWKKQSP
jgi:hypothetical protein